MAGPIVHPATNISKVYHVVNSRWVGDILSGLNFYTGGYHIIPNLHEST